MMQATAGRVKLGAPSTADGAAMWKLARSAGSLELNSAYSYLMMADMFRATCCTAHDGGELVGFATAFRKPDSPEVLFVWQISVAAALRGQGLGKAMLNDIMRREANRGIRYIEATISPNNQASRSMFAGMAKQLGCECAVSNKYASEWFPEPEGHEDEWLYRIGPIRMG